MTDPSHVPVIYLSAVAASCAAPRAHVTNTALILIQVIKQAATSPINQPERDPYRIYAKQVLDGRSGHWIASGRAIRQFRPRCSTIYGTDQLILIYLRHDSTFNVEQISLIYRFDGEIFGGHHFSSFGKMLCERTIGLLTRNKDGSGISFSVRSVNALDRPAGRRDGRQPEARPVFPEGRSLAWLSVCFGK